MARRVRALVAAQPGEIVAARGRRVQRPGRRLAAERRQRRALGPRVHEAAHVGLDVAPGAEQAERKARLEHDASERQPAAARRGHAEHHLAHSARRDIDHELRARGEMAREDRRPVERGAAVEVQAKLRRLAGEHRLGAAGGYRDAREIARGMHHPREAEAGEQEGEGKAERQRVVDRADEQHRERAAEEPAQARRHDVNAPVHELHRAALRRSEAVEPVGEARVTLEKALDHAVGPSYFQRPRQAPSTRLGYSGFPRLPL